MPLHSTLCPIVGVYFREPRGHAQAICDSLPTGTKLTLVPEPTNQFDPNAIQVALLTAELPDHVLGALEETLLGYGITTDDLLAQTAYHLGYIPKEIAPVLLPKIPTFSHGEFCLTFDEKKRKELPHIKAYWEA